MNQIPWSTLLAAVAVCLCSPSQLAAAPVTYTSLADWQAAVTGRTLVSQDFSSFLVDTPFTQSAANAGWFTLQQFGTDKSSNFISGNPGNIARMRTNFGSAVVHLDFGVAPVSAWGAAFTSAASGEKAQITLYGPGDILIAAFAIPASNGFFGFVTSSPEHVSRLEFSSITESVGSAENFDMDNVVGAYGDSSGVPEPGSLFLLGGGLAAFLLHRQRK